MPLYDLLYSNLWCARLNFHSTKLTYLETVTYITTNVFLTLKGTGVTGSSGRKRHSLSSYLAGKTEVQWAILPGIFAASGNCEKKVIQPVKGSALDNPTQSAVTPQKKKAG